MIFKDFKINDYRLKQYRNNRKVLVDLKKDKKQKKEKEFDLIVWDIETWGLNPNNLALSSFYNGKNYFNHYTKKDILDFIDKLEKDTLIYAHNGSNFDINLFFDEILLSSSWRMQKTGNILHFTYKNKLGKTIKFKDSYYILQRSLKDLAKDFLDKTNQKLEIDKKFIDPTIVNFEKEKYLKNIEKFNRKNITKDDIVYCNQDTKVLYDLIHLELFNELDFDFKNNNTIAAIAYKKLIDNSTNLVIDRSIDLEFMKLYKGGICDVYKHSNTKKEILCLDYNSFYPWAMTTSFGNPSKMERIHFSLDYTQEFLNELNNEWLEMLLNYPNGYSEVNIHIKDNLNDKTIKMLKKLPLFPNLGMNFFDYTNNQDYQVTIMNSELVNLIDYFNIQPIFSVYSKLKDCHTPFKDYILEMYKNKEQASRNNENAKKFIFKLLLNSSYGRLGLKTQADGFMVGSYEFIKEKITRNLYRAIEQEEANGYLYIYELQQQRLKVISELDKAYKEGIGDGERVLKYIKNFQEQIKVNFNGYNIKAINQIDKRILKENSEDIYIVSYQTSKEPHEESSYYYASEITSKCRAKLIKDMIDIELNTEGEIIYTDTDSFHIDTNNANKILDYLDKKKMIDPYEIGKLDNEGIYQKGYWLSKKHYYIFSEIDSKYIMKKQALKGFTPHKNLDYFVHTSPEVFVNKIYSRVSNININSNTLLDSKTFLNFVSKRKINNELFTLNEYKNKGEVETEILQHSILVKDIFFDILKSGKYYIENDNNIELITLEKVEKRIIELEKEFKAKVDLGIFKYDIENFNLTSKEIEKQIKKIVKRQPKEKKERESRKKPTILELALKKKKAS